MKKSCRYSLSECMGENPMYSLSRGRNLDMTSRFTVGLSLIWLRAIAACLPIAGLLSIRRRILFAPSA